MVLLGVLFVVALKAFRWLGLPTYWAVGLSLLLTLALYPTAAQLVNAVIETW